MKVTGWTTWNIEDDKWTENCGYVDPDNERLKLWNPEKKLFSPTKDEVSQYAANFYVTKEEAQKRLKAEWDAKPNYIDEKKAEEYSNITKECEEVLIKYCIDNHVFKTDYEHQGGKNGVPVFDDKYILTYTLRAWGGLMADVWNEILKTDKFGYLDFYCGGCPKEVEDFLKLEKENR